MIFLYLCSTNIKTYVIMKSELSINLSSDYARELRYYLRETAAKKLIADEYVPDGVYYLLGVLSLEHEKEIAESLKSEED